jgi:hypothetical protein
MVAVSITVRVFSRHHHAVRHFLLKPLKNSTFLQLEFYLFDPVFNDAVSGWDCRGRLVNGDLEGMWEQELPWPHFCTDLVFSKSDWGKPRRISVTLISLWVLTSGVTNALNSTTTSFDRYVIMPSTIAEAPLLGSLPNPPLRYPLTSALQISYPIT